MTRPLPAILAALALAGCSRPAAPAPATPSPTPMPPVPPPAETPAETPPPGRPAFFVPDAEIASLFADAVALSNVWLPREFWTVLNQ